MYKYLFWIYLGIQNIWFEFGLISILKYQIFEFIQIFSHFQFGFDTTFLDRI